MVAREAQSQAAYAGTEILRACVCFLAGEISSPFFKRLFHAIHSPEAMKKILLFSALLSIVAVPFARADDSVRSAQVILQQDGYYTGPTDGTFNADTKAAVRRYQIRNQLEPSGELTPETIAALNKEGGNAQPAAPAPSVAAPVPQPPAPAPELPLPPPPVPNSPPGAVQGIPVPPPGQPALVDPAYATIFARTPYERAPADIQFSTLRKAQKILAERGIFQGVVDGQPGPATEEALLRYQSLKHLPRTGRLDIDTLAELHLMPISKLPRPRVAPAPYEPPIPPTPRGAVRGVPVD